MFDNQVILITGGTGSFGKHMVQTLLEQTRPRKVIIFSRDELKQYQMAQRFDPAEHPCLRYFIGDVRDENRLMEALDGVNVVIHAAALKQIPATEYNPIEAVHTNIQGAENVINAAIDRGVDRVIDVARDEWFDSTSSTVGVARFVDGGDTGEELVSSRVHHPGLR